MTKIQNLKRFGHWVLEFEIYPSTLLRVVSLSNHLLFVIWCLCFGILRNGAALCGCRHGSALRPTLLKFQVSGYGVRIYIVLELVLVLDIGFHIKLFEDEDDEEDLSKTAKPETLNL